MGKGKEREMKDKDFEEERAWLLLNGVPVTTTTAQGTDVSDLLEEEGDLECGCCFSDVPFVRFRIPSTPTPPNNSFIARHDPMHGGSLILQRMHGRLRFQPPRRVQFRDRLHGPIGMQVSIPRVGTEAFPDPEASIVVLEGEAGEGD